MVCGIQQQAPFQRARELETGGVWNLIEMIHFTSFSKSKSVLGFRDCETYAESYFFSLAFLEPILKCQNCLRIDMKDVVCRSCFFTNLPKLKIDKA